jgi:hypothetical protein
MKYLIIGVVVFLGLVIWGIWGMYDFYSSPCEELLQSNISLQNIPARCLPLIDQGNISGLRK